jgi:hypothetical protein
VIFVFSVLTTADITVPSNKNIVELIISRTIVDYITAIIGYFQAGFVPTPDKDIVNYIVSIVGFLLTALSFLFVVFQVTALAKQINKQEEQFHKDSEFKIFLEATKMLTSAENKNSATAQISAMYLLYDYAKKYPNNIEKVIHILNRFPVPYFYPTIKHKERRVISEWKVEGNSDLHVVYAAMKLIKQLFVFSIENKKRPIDLSGVVLFNFDVDIDIKIKTPIKLSDTVTKLNKTTFAWCNFSYSTDKKTKQGKIDFSTDRKTIENYKTSNMGKLDIGLSTFLSCDLTNCDFSYSNLWGVRFENCTLTNAIFNQTECEGVEFDNSIIKDEQIRKMLFLSRNDGRFDAFNNETERVPSLEYGIIHQTPTCFKDWNEYNEFKNEKFKSKKQEPEITKHTLAKIKQFLCQRLCQ